MRLSFLGPSFSSSSIGYTESKGMCWSKKKNENRRESIKVVACSGYGRSRCWCMQLSICRWIFEINRPKTKDEGERQAINSFACIGKCRFLSPRQRFHFRFFRSKAKNITFNANGLFFGGNAVRSLHRDLTTSFSFNELFNHFEKLFNERTFFIIVVGFCGILAFFSFHFFHKTMKL